MSYADTEIKQTSKFLKIEEGKPMVIRLLDDPPIEVMKHSLKGANADGKFQVDCKGEDLCDICQDGQDPVQKFITNVYNHTLHKVQLYEFGPMIAKAIKKIAVNLAEENQDIMNFDLKVEAEGAGMQKKYTVTPRTTSQTLPPGLVKIKIDSGLAF
jgi:hypothetical protein